MAKFISSQKGNRKLVLGDYMYTKKREGSNGKEVWVCETRTCQSIVHTLDDAIVKSSTEHNHAPIHSKVKISEVRLNMKRRAEETEESPRLVFQQSLTQVSLEDAHHLPSRATLTRDICRRRQNAGASGANAEDYGNTINGDRFLRVNQPDMLIFAAQGLLDS